MSEDIDPTLGLDDASAESIDTQPSFENDTDLTAPMGMSEFDPGYPGLDPDNSGTGWTDGGSSESGTGQSTDTGDSGDGGWGTLGTGSESGNAGGSAGSGDGAGSSGESDSDNWMKGAMGSESDSGSDAGLPDEADTSGTEATSSTEEFETEEPTPPTSSTDEEAGTAGAQPGDLTVSIDGEDIVVGPPTLDITGDGVADTVVVESEGNVEYYVDTDQDGVADQIIVLDEQDGTLVNHEVYDPSSGTWTNVTADSKGNS